MKKSNKGSPNKASGKGIKSAPLFKKPKSSQKLKLPKEIDENIITKTKFNKAQTKKSNNQNHAPAADSKSKKNKALQTIKSEPIVQDASLVKGKFNSKTKKTEPKTSSKTLIEAIPAVKVRKQSAKLLPSTYISEPLVTKAVNALFQLAEQQKKKNKMFEDEANVFAQIMCIKIQNKRGNIRFALPHSTVASTGEVCLITPDLKKGRKPDHEPSVEHWEETLRSAGVTQVKTVLPMRQLRVEYDQYELKRRLLTQHDFILVDSRILNHVSHLLGKGFFKKHNMLVPVRLHNVKDIKKNIDGALKTAILRLNEGQTSTILVGHMGMNPKEIKENIQALVRQLPEKFPGGDQNIRSLSIKLPLSLALPLFVTLRSKKTVMPPRFATELPKQHRAVEGELSTFMSGTVKVMPDGAVTFHRDGDDEQSDIEEENEEDEMPETTKKTKNTKVKTGKKEVKESKDILEETVSDNDSGDQDSSGMDEDITDQGTDDGSDLE